MKLVKLRRQFGSLALPSTVTNLPRRLPTHVRQPPARKNKLDTTDDITTCGKRACPSPKMEHGTLRPYAKCWCAASTCSMEQKPRGRVQRKRTHRGTGRSLSTRASSSDMMTQAPAHWCWVRDHGDQRRGPGWTGFKSDVVVHAKTQPVSRRSSIALWGFCVSWTGKPTCNCSKKQKTMNSHGAVGTSTLAVACALASKPQLPFSSLRGHIHPCCRQHVQKLQKNHSSSFQKKQKSTTSLQCAIDTFMAQHLQRLVEPDHTVRVIAVVVQRPKSSLAIRDIQEETT